MEINCGQKWVKIIQAMQNKAMYRLSTLEPLFISLVFWTLQSSAESRLPSMTSYTCYQSESASSSKLFFRCDIAPEYLMELCRPVSLAAGGQSLRCASRGDLTIPRFRLRTFGFRTFVILGPQLWNSLPLDVRQSQDNLILLAKIPGRWIVDGRGGFSKRVIFYIVVTFIFNILD